MDNILKALYDHFYHMPENTSEEERIKINHHILRQRFNSRNRKLVLRIMDDKDLICSDISIDSLFTASGWRGRLQIKYRITTGVRIAAKELSRMPVQYFTRRKQDEKDNYHLHHHYRLCRPVRRCVAS